MADDWIKMRTDLYRDPKVCAIADILLDPAGELARFINQNCQRNMTLTRNVMRNVTVGALVTVWGVTRKRGKRYGDDLKVTGVTLSVIDDIADLPGFGAAMQSVGWLVEVENGLVLPRFFEDWNVDPRAELNKQNAERQRRYRERHRNVTVTSQSNAREEKRREEKNNTPPTPQAGGVELPAALNSDQFKTAWERWETYRREIRHALKDTTRKSQLKKLAEWGEAKAIAAIEQSILHGWQGLFEPGANGKATASDKPTETTAERHARNRREVEERRQRDAERADPPEVIKEKLRKAVPGLEQR